MNALPSDATAASQRRAVLETSYSAGWMDDADAAPSTAWVRAIYREVFADTGGVPVPGAAYDGPSELLRCYSRSRHCPSVHTPSTGVPTSRMTSADAAGTRLPLSSEAIVRTTTSLSFSTW